MFVLMLLCHPYASLAQKVRDCKTDFVFLQAPRVKTKKIKI